MKTVLFCQNAYAFGVLRPIMEALKEHKEPYIWFVKPSIAAIFPFEKEAHTSDLNVIAAFQSDVIFVPGNEVPHYLRGVKAQVFHGLAGEKKGHFRIRDYFDLYLTQGPYFTEKFNILKTKNNNFDVIETGWPKLDVYGKESLNFDQAKLAMLLKYKVKKIILYAPTFSPSLTSAPYLLNEIEELAKNSSYLILCKFHDLMDKGLIADYKELGRKHKNIVFEEERNISKFLYLADILISDTSSVVYEFLLLDKPVITFKSSSKNIVWKDSKVYKNLVKLVVESFSIDPFKQQRAIIREEYHPYNDGNSALRMLAAVRKYIHTNGVPEKRKLSFLRRRKIHKIFGKIKLQK